MPAREASATTAPGPNFTNTQHTDRPCGATDLSARASGSNGLAGITEYYVSLTNISTAPCDLGGFPLGLADGTTGAAILTDNEPPILPLHPGVLSPGQSGLLEILSSNSCNQPTKVDFPHFAIVFSDGRVPVTIGTGADIGPLFIRCSPALLQPMGLRPSRT